MDIRCRTPVPRRVLCKSTNVVFALPGGRRWRERVYLYSPHWAKKKQHHMLMQLHRTHINENADSRAPEYLLRRESIICTRRDRMLRASLTRMQLECRRPGEKKAVICYFPWTHYARVPADLGKSVNKLLPLIQIMAKAERERELATLLITMGNRQKIMC